MAGADIKIVAIALIIFVTYGVFLYLNASAEETIISSQNINSSDYTTPESTGFWATVTEIGQMNIDNPEIFFINSILFGTIAFLLVFVGLRFLRGTG